MKVSKFKYFSFRTIIISIGLFGVIFLMVIASPVRGATIEELLTQIANIQSQIGSLQNQLAELQPSAVIYEGIPAGFVFENNLKYGMRNNEVKYLQIILKKEVGPPTYPERALATGYFGLITKNSVIKFQEKYASEILTPLGLTKGTGFVGKTTRAKLNQLLTPTTCLPSPPSMSILSLPADGSTNQSLLSTLSWQTPSSWGAGCPDDRKYRIQIDDDSQFSSPLTNAIVSSPATFYTVSSGILSYNTNYYWRVRAENNAQYSDWNTKGFQTLAVTTPVGFSLSVSPTSGSVAQGKSVSTTITTTLVSGISQSVNFSTSSLPSGATVSFSPISCNPTCPSVMQITTSSTTPTGIYLITITGAGSGLTRTATYTLTITALSALSVSLSANPSSGKAPLDVELAAEVSGITTGPANYIFYCNRSDPGTDVIPGYNKRINYVFSSSYTDICNYPSPGTYTAKIIVERGGLAAENRVTINVASGQCADGTLYGQCSTVKPKYCDNGTLIDKCGTCGCPSDQQCQADGNCIVPTLSVSLSANPSSGSAPLNDVDLTAQVSGTATGPINYTFYCNRSDSGTNITPGYAHKKDGTTLNPYTVLDICDYSTAGTYIAKVIVERGTLVAENRMTIIVSEIPPPEILTPKVLLLIFNPIIESRGSRRLTEVYGWNNPDNLASQYIGDIKSVSSNFVNYTIVERMEVDAFTTYTDGYSLDDATYLSCWEARNCDHGDAGRGQPMIDYQFMTQQYNLCEKLNAGEIDEVWTFSYPYSGFWESTLAGPGAFWYNSPPVTGTTCNKLLPIMGFSYERGVGEMLEDLGHRTESVMTYVFGSWAPNENHDWNKFTLYDKVAPGKANCGNVHYGPNSLSDYDWANTNYVDSYCDDWYNYPTLQGIKKLVNCTTWGCEIRGHHKWWLKHLPRAGGTTNGKLNNWWRYIVDYNNI